MTIQAGGLATGLDTNGLIQELLKLERQPVERLEQEKSYQSSRLETFKAFDTKLDDFLGKIGGLSSVSELVEKSVTLSAEGYVAATPTSSAQTGLYRIEVIDLAQVQKSVSQGYADKDAFDFGTGNIKLNFGGGPPTIISIDNSNNSLTGIRDAINAAGAGVTATIINDGTADPYRLVLSGEDVSTSFSVDTKGLKGGKYADPSFTDTQTAQQAHVKVDGIDIYSNDNSLSGAIPGVSLDLLKAEPGTVTTLTVGNDAAAMQAKLDEFVAAYNDIFKFVSANESIRSDSGVRGIQRSLQNLLVTAVGGTSSYQTLSQLGLETQRDGTLKVDSARLEDALKNNLDDVIKLLTGETGVEGMAVRLENYLEGLTDSQDGLYAGRKKTINQQIDRIDSNIERIEWRLQQREQTLLAQFTALETMVSSLNAQSDYLTQQLSMMSNIWSQKS